jgi:RNA-binding protein YhbY
MIKIKAQKASLAGASVAEMADRIANETSSEIVDIRGRTFTIYRERKPGQRQKG